MPSKPKLSTGEKTAKINGKYLIIGAIITVIGGGIFTFYKNTKSDKNSSTNLSANEQNVDTGSINNFNAGRDVKIENNTYNDIRQEDSLKVQIKKEVQNLDNTKQKNDNLKIYSKNQIVNNAPNQGVQINENKGTVIVGKATPAPRKFLLNDAKKILKEYPLDFPIEIQLKGTNEESKALYNQVLSTVQSMGYRNISTTMIGVYLNVGQLLEKDFEHKIEEGKFVFSIYLQKE